jgi:hypothetical protein
MFITEAFMSDPTDVVLELFGQPTDSPPDPLPTKTVSVRLDVETLTWVDEIASHAECSRQHILSRVVDLGLSSLLSAMPPEIRDSIEGDVFSSLNSQE